MERNGISISNKSYLIKRMCNMIKNKTLRELLTYGLLGAILMLFILSIITAVDLKLLAFGLFLIGFVFLAKNTSSEAN